MPRNLRRIHTAPKARRVRSLCLSTLFLGPVGQHRVMPISEALLSLLRVVCQRILFYTPPSCDSANIQGIDLDDYDLLEFCSELEEHFVFHGAVQFQLDKHVGVLGDLIMDFTEKGCDSFRYAYSQCWWCAPNITNDNNYCSFDALCASSQVEEKEEEQQEVENTDEENPIISTCNELDWWVGEEGRKNVTFCLYGVILESSSSKTNN